MPGARVASIAGAFDMPMPGPATLFVLGAAAAAAPPPAVGPVELWNGFTTASTAAEIKAFKASKPKRRVEVFPGCTAEMIYRFKDRRLVSIIFLGQDRDADCFARMFADFRGRLGQPELDTTTFGGMIGYGTGSAVGTIDTTSTGVVYIWREGEKKTKIVKSPGDGYNLIFTVRPDRYIH